MGSRNSVKHKSPSGRVEGFKCNSIIFRNSSGPLITLFFFGGYFLPGMCPSNNLGVEYRPEHLPHWGCSEIRGTKFPGIMQFRPGLQGKRQATWGLVDKALLIIKDLHLLEDHLYGSPSRLEKARLWSQCWVLMPGSCLDFHIWKQDG